MKLSWLPLVLLSGILAGCIYDIGDYTPKTTQRFLSITAELNDRPSSQKVVLKYSAAGLTNSYVSEPVLGAKVILTDDSGLQKTYLESSTEKGTYVLSNFAGQLGRTYTLKIELKNGSIYESNPQKMNPCPAIDKIYAVASLEENRSILDRLRGGHNIYIDFRDSPERQFYRWTYTHTERLSVCAQCPYGWDFFKNACIERGRFGQNVNNPFIYYCDGKCWDKETSSEFNIFSDALVNDKPVNGVFIKRVPYVGKANIQPQDRYHIEVVQMSLTEEVYNYYKSLKNIDNQGSFFDVPSLTVFSRNIHNVQNPEEKILGVFDVNSQKNITAMLKIDTPIPGAEKQYDVIYGVNPCQVVACPIKCIETNTRTVQEPNGWIE